MFKEIAVTLAVLGKCDNDEIHRLGAGFYRDQTVSLCRRC